MNESKFKSDKGITLVALIVTIIILVIIAAVSIKTIYDMNFVGVAIKGTEGYMEAQMNEMDKMESLAKYLEEVTKSITEGNGNEEEDPEGPKDPEQPEQPDLPVVTYTWTQNKTSVTNGEVTIEVGSAVTGYTGNGVGNGSWYVLGAENGKLLITTNSNQESVYLSGQDGYVNGVNILNIAGAKYSDNNMADSARSINVEDINRVTGYNPDVANYNSGNNVDQWKNVVTYTMNSDGYTYCKGIKYPTSSTRASDLSFTYWTGSTWKTLASGESATITHNYYLYYPQTLSATPSSDTQINGSTNAYNLLFANTTGRTVTYWLASQCVSTSMGSCHYSMRIVGGGTVSETWMFRSYNGPDNYSSGLRPVVTLKSNVKVTSGGALSI